MTKVPKGSFENTAKEPFTARLKQLQKGRTINQLSDEWGVKPSTLKNYFARPNSKPRYETLVRIAAKEGVSIEWLLGENEDELLFTGQRQAQKDSINTHENLFGMLRLLGDDKLDALTTQLMLKGIETVLGLLDDVNIRFLQLPDEEKERLMALHDAKKGASSPGEENDLTNSTHRQVS